MKKQAKKKQPKRPDKMNAMQPSFQKGWYTSLTKHKGLEIELLKWPRNHRRISAEIRFTPRTSDHAGVRIEFTCFHWELSAEFYDGRHADEYTPKKSKS